MANNDLDKIAQLTLLYRKNPIIFVRDVIGITLSPKQQHLFLEAVKPNSRLACKSATGTGKTCTLACVILHQLITEAEGVKIIATSPSAGQLERGLRAEVGKLLQQMKVPFKDFYVLMKEKIYIDGKSDTHFCSFVTGSAENKESLAGVHAPKVLILVDEASAVLQEIYDTLVGNLTTHGSSLIQISNPVRPNGPFFNLWANNEVGKMWTLVTLTAWDSPFISKEWIEGIKQEYGEDSDFYRMRCLGEFPRASNAQFISTDVVSTATVFNASPNSYVNYPILMGVDVARFGDDSTVFTLRQGPKLLDIVEYKGLDTMEVAARVLEYATYKHPRNVYVDGGGLGAGVVDRCKQLKLPVVDVVVGSNPTDPKQYANLRAQLWGLMREWLGNGADIQNNKELIEQLTGMQYGFNNRMQIQLMSKKDIKKLGLPSPDIADSLALTFADDIYQQKRARLQPRQIIKSNTLWC